MAEPAPGFLEGLRELADAGRLRPRLRRDDHRHALVAARRPARLRRDPGPVHLGQGARQRLPVSALAGRRELMELGGLRTDASRVFLLSTTHGPETAALAAYLAVRARLPGAGRRGRRWSAQGSRLAEAVTDEVRGRRARRTTSPWSGRPSCLVFATRGPDGEPVAGVPHPVPAGAAAARGARPVLRHLRGPHRRRPPGHRRRGRRALPVYRRALDRGDADRALPRAPGRARAAGDDPRLDRCPAPVGDLRPERNTEEP